MENPLVSIIIPIHNVESYLARCLQSIINQTYKNLDIILVDDGSTDNSLNIALQYAQNDNRILIIQKPNALQSSAKNMGLEFIHGSELRECIFGNTTKVTSYTQNSFNEESKIIDKETILKHFTTNNNHIKTNLEDISTLLTQKLPEDSWIRFVDSDDYLPLDNIERCVRETQNNKHLELVSLSHSITNDNNTNTNDITCDSLCRYESLSYDNGLEMLKNHKKYISSFCWQGIINTNILNRYNLRHQLGIYCEDLDFGTILYALCRGFLYKNFIGYIYTIRENSTMHYTKTMPQKMPRILEPLRGHFTNYKDLGEYFLSYSKVIAALHIYRFYKQINLQDKKAYKKLFTTYILHYILHYKNKDILNLINKLKEEKLIKYPRLIFLYSKAREIYRHPSRIFKSN